MVAIRGTAAVIEDPERMAAARERIFPKYGGYETDGGNDDRADDRNETNGEGGEATGAQTGALIEITIGSATTQRY